MTFLKTLPTLSGTLWASEIDPGSSRLSSPRNEFVFQGVNSSSYWNDTEINFVFKSMNEWAAWNSASLVQNDVELTEFKTRSMLIFSESMDHILHTTNTTRSRRDENLFHLVGGYVGLDIYNSFTSSYLLPSTAPRGEIFGCVDSITTPGALYRFNLNPALSSSAGSYMVKCTSLNAEGFVFASNQTATSFDVYTREVRNPSQGIAAVNDIRAGRFDVMIFSDFTGSLI